MEEVKNYFTELNKIDVSKWVEKKGNLSYVSWANAWAELKKRHPEAFYTIYENEQGWNYFTDGHTCWVKTGVTINGLEHIEYLPVMDYKNKSILAENVTSMDINKTIQRSLTKACARHGLGLYIYAGEDLPEAERDEAAKEEELSDDDIISSAWAGAILRLVEETKSNERDMLQYISNLSGKPVLSIEEMTYRQAKPLISQLKERKAKQEKARKAV